MSEPKPDDASTPQFNAAAKRPMRSRFKPQITAGMQLQERDLKLLTDLFLHRLMSRCQLERLYFTSASRCNVRLRQLFDHKLVARYYCSNRVGLTGGFSPVWGAGFSPLKEKYPDMQTRIPSQLSRLTG